MSESTDRLEDRFFEQRRNLKRNEAIVARGGLTGEGKCICPRPENENHAGPCLGPDCYCHG